MINNIEERIRLDDGHEMPGYGYGCYKAFGAELTEAIQIALACGYRYIDTASFYENEETVGAVLKAAPVSRAQLYVVSKIWPSQFSNPVRAVDASLRLLKLDYLDGYLLHWPGLNTSSRLKTWEILMREKEKGKILDLGVSNFLASHLEELNHYFEIWPVMNQIEVHPLYANQELCDFCKLKGIQVVSWAPLGRGNALSNSAILRIAQKLNKTPAQVILRWHVQKSLVPIPKSVHPDRVIENAQVFDFSLGPEQMSIIDSLNLPADKGRTGKDPMLFPAV